MSLCAKLITAIFCTMLITNSRADTPPPGTVKAKVFDGTGAQAIGNVGDSLKVNVTNTGGVSTVDQGNAGVQSWLVNITNTPIPVTQSGIWSFAVTGSVDVSGSSVSVSNFPATQAINLTQIAGLSPSVTNSIPARITNGTSFVDPTQIRALSSIGDSVTAVISGTPTVTANAGSGTFQTNVTNSSLTVIQPTGTNLHTVIDSGSVTANAGTNLNTSLLALESGHLASIDTKLTAPLSVTGPLTDTQLRASPVPVSGTVTTGGLTDTQLRASPVPVSVPGSVAVTGTFFQATQPVSIASAVTVEQTTAANLNATVIGSVTANAGTNLNTSSLALESGGHLASIDSKVPALGQALAAASVPVVLTAAQLSTLTPLSSVGVTQVTSPWLVSGSGNFTVVQATGTNLHAVIDSGSITANAGTNLNTSALALSATQTNGNQKTQLVDGTGAVIGPAQTISGTNYQPVVLAASGTPGSAVPARAVQIGGSDGTNLRALSVDTSGNLNVNTTSSSGRTSIVLARNDYTTTNVTTAAYVQLVASTSDVINQLYIFDSSGQTLFLAVGAAASEVNKAYIVPGGNGILNLTIPAGSRISIKAVSATASAGELSISFFK